jgi:hypothetical protein
MPTGSGSRRCRGWWTAADGRRSSRSRQPQSCAGTVTWSPASGPLLTGVGQGDRPRAFRSRR